MKTVPTLDKAIEWIKAKNTELPTEPQLEFVRGNSLAGNEKTLWRARNQCFLCLVRPGCTKKSLNDVLFFAASFWGKEDYNHLCSNCVGVILDRFFGGDKRFLME